MNALERELLDVYGLDTVPAYSGAEALEVWGRRDTDAVLLDIMLPGIDGFEICRHIKQSNSGGFPVVLVTALDSDECRRRGSDAGADAYFVKPFDPCELVEVLRGLIDDHQSAPR